MKRAILISAIVTSFLPAMAAADTVEVKHGDLNLANPSDQAKLARRIEVAAGEACHVSVHPGSNFATPKQRECARVAAASAREQLAAAISAANAPRFAVANEPAK